MVLMLLGAPQTAALFYAFNNNTLTAETSIARQPRSTKNPACAHVSLKDDYRGTKRAGANEELCHRCRILQLCTMRGARTRCPEPTLLAVVAARLLFAQFPSRAYRRYHGTFTTTILRLPCTSSMAFSTVER